MLGIRRVDVVEDKENVAVEAPQTKSRPFTIAVEGNIGSGKSTFLQYFQKLDIDVKVIPEPVNKWKDVNGHNTLEMMYKDASRWSLAFQSYVQLTMAEGHKEEVSCIKMMERSIFSARNCFVENLYKNGLMPEVDYAILSEFYQWILDNEQTDVDLIVYLRADPKVCQERIRKRNRHEEKDVPLEYLQSLHDLHEDWLMKETKFKLPAPIYVIDANADIADLYPKFSECKNHILSLKS